MNVLVLGGRVIGIELARELIRAFLNARFTGEARHLRRLAKLTALENRLRALEVATEEDRRRAYDEIVGFAGITVALLGRAHPVGILLGAIAIVLSAGEVAVVVAGSVFPADGQPTPPGPSNDAGELAWTPWFSVPAAIPPSEFFRFDGGQPTGEISSFPQLATMPEPTPVTSFASQEIDGSLFHPGEALCLSVDAKVAGPATDRQKLTLIATAAFNATRVYRVSFPGSQLTDQYRRFNLCFVLDANAVSDGGVLRVEFLNEMERNAVPQTMFWTRPMLAEGFDPAPWTAAPPSAHAPSSAASPVRVWHSEFLWTAPGYIVGAAAAAAFVSVSVLMVLL